MLKSIMKRFRAILVATGMLAALSSTAFAQGLAANLAANPINYQGQCPATITFTGTISLDRPGTVRYRFIRSDGGRGQWVTLKFEQAGQQEVSATWRLGGARLKSYTGWEAIQIVYPRVMFSNRAHFSMHCGV